MVKTMALGIHPRIFPQCVRLSCRPRRLIIPLSIRRAASSKHPKGFVPPTQEDLNELRESVQEFTRS